MRKIYIADSACVDDRLMQVADVNPTAALVWPWFLLSLDDWGRGTAHPRQLRARLFPENPAVTVEIIDEALHLYAAAGLVVLYEVDDRPFVAIPAEEWFGVQTHIRREKRTNDGSRYPAPPDPAARTCAQSRADARSSPQCCASPSPSTLPPFHPSKKADSGALRSDFEEWWEASGRAGSKADAWGLYRWWRTQGGAGRDELLAAVVNYRAHCTATNCFMQHGRTFLVKPTKTQAARWPEWASGEAHGSSDVAGVDRVSDVLEVGLEWMGGSHENASLGDRSVAGIGAGDREADPAVSEDARRGLPALRLAGGE